MNQLLAGITLIVLGVVLLIVSAKSARTRQENATTQTPYLKNGGIGFVLFGLYYLLRYFIAQ